MSSELHHERLEAEAGSFALTGFQFADVYVLHCPLPEVTIWRYMDLAKFVSMLAKGGLFFCSIPTLWSIDKWEAAYPVEFLLAHEMGAAVRDSMREKRQRELERTFISCWHENAQESAAMWKLYSSGAYTIAIRSTIQHLRDAFAEPKQDVDIHSVDYIDYSTETKPWNNLEEPIFTKRKSFKHEMEVRAVTYTQEPMHGTPGIVVPANLSVLIDAVYTSPHDPTWFSDVVKSLLSKYGFGAIPLVPSQLNEGPTSI